MVKRRGGDSVLRKVTSNIYGLMEGWVFQRYHSVEQGRSGSSSGFGTTKTEP